MTHAKDTITGGEAWQSHAVDARLIKDGGGIANALGDVVGQIEEANGGFGDHTVRQDDVSSEP